MGGKLKPISLRKPKDSISHVEMVKEVAKETGFLSSDVDRCIDAYLNQIRLELLDRKSVKVRSIGSLIPIVKPPKKVVNMGGSSGQTYEPMILDAKWYIMFQMATSLIRDVEDIMVTKKDLDKIYYKNK